MYAVVSSNTKIGLVCLLSWLALGGLALAEDAPAAMPPAPPSDAAPAASSAEAPSLAEAERPAANGVFLEGLGAGVLYSLNYERVVADAVAVRLGFSYWSV